MARPANPYDLTALSILINIVAVRSGLIPLGGSRVGSGTTGELFSRLSALNSIHAIYAAKPLPAKQAPIRATITAVKIEDIAMPLEFFGVSAESTGAWPRRKPE